MLMSVVFEVETTDMSLGSVPAICLHRSARARHMTAAPTGEPLTIAHTHLSVYRSDASLLKSPEDNHDFITSVRSTC